MATNTPNLNLLKKDPVTDGNETFNVQTMLNDNWDKIDAAVGSIRQQVEQIEIDIPVATLEQPGITQLSNAINSDAEDRAATPKAVKAAADDARGSIFKLSRDVANLNMQLEASKRVTDGFTFGSNFADSFGMEIDTTKLISPTALEVGQTEITVDTIGTLAAGMEVTVYDDVNMERTTVNEVATTQNFVTKTTENAVVKSGISGLSTDGGRKLIRLNNGVLISTGKYATGCYIVKSADDGNTWASLWATATVQDVTLVSLGERFVIFYAANGTTLRVIIMDENGSMAQGGEIQFTGDATSLGTTVSADFNPADSTLHLAWHGKTASASNSDNIKYMKCPVNVSAGTLTAGTVETVTTSNATNVDNIAPCIALNANGSPVIVYSGSGSSAVKGIFAFIKSGGGWTGKSAPYNTGSTTYMQYAPSVVFVPSSVNGLSNGRIWCTWWGTTATITTGSIFVSYSDDGGNTWSTPERISPVSSKPKTYPSITADKNGVIYVLSRSIGEAGSDNSYDICMVKNAGGSWGAETTVVESYYVPVTGTAQHYYPQTLNDISMEFVVPPFIYRTIGLADGDAVSFYGSWKEIGAATKLTFNPLTKHYKTGAVIARTTAVVDAVNKALKFGSFRVVGEHSFENNDTVVADRLNYLETGNKSLVRLPNGWLVLTTRYGSNGLRFYKSTDEGKTWSMENSYSFPSVSSYSVVAKGNYLFGIVSYNTSQLSWFRFNVVDGGFTQAALDSSLVQAGYVSLAINSAGTELHAAYDFVSTSGGQANIRYVKGTIDTSNNISWSAVENATTMVGAYLSARYPSVVLRQDGTAVILATATTSSTQYFVIAISKAFSGTSQSGVAMNSGWGNMTVYSPTPGAGQDQAYTCAVFIPQSINGLANGQITVAWQGRNTSELSAWNIWIATSTNGGASWTTAQMTTGNTYSRMNPSLSMDKTGKTYLFYSGNDVNDASTDIRMRAHTPGVGWNSEQIISQATTASKSVPVTQVDFTMTWELPPLAYYDTNGVYFSGAWTKTTEYETPLTESDVRFKLKDTDEVVLWVQRDEGVSLAARINGETMDKTSTAGEDQYTIALDESGPAECKLVMTRADTATDLKITRILGGVA
ncbi:exo-alpha-sialidase [Paenibacillus sp. DXFW5]|uniref:Exo-alpha-sialidase n=1 Tax=Paenibacillus rhizolycopersici TaxID=2780073 RepID=A0ABS2H5G7_9BACL|nr:tail fiber protein [Paenibacillus rhizolycopersici]MBM6995055.1 exo-alpha-sialidase [Paenibacillus rhizolycopersici]